MMAPVIIVPGNNTVRPIGSHVWMALGLAAGLGLGLAAVLTHSPVLLAATQWLRPLGTLFLNLLSMVVIPLVATALFAGIAGLGDLRRVGRLGVRTLGFLWGTTLAGIVIGFVVAALLLPLAPITPDQQAALRQTVATDSGAVGHAAEQITTGARFIVELIPSNPVRAAVDGNLLPLIVFITIFAVAAAALPDEKRHTLTDLADVATQALIRIVRWVLRLAPVGIFAIVAGAVAQFGVDLIKAMAGVNVAVMTRLAVFLASLTVASVPSASIVSLVPAFTATGLPLTGLQLLLGLDRIPDMFRTMTNVFGTLTAATVVDAVESRTETGHAQARRTDAQGRIG